MQTAPAAELVSPGTPDQLSYIVPDIIIINIPLIMHLQLLYVRMESTEKCEAIIQHFNGKYIKTPPGVAGTTFGLFSYWPDGYDQ